MKIAIVHYHLRPGGISRTISPTFRSCKSGTDVVFFTGEVPEADFPGDVPVAILPGLEESGDEESTPKSLADAMIRQARAALGDLPDVWHVFNHTVGKNVVLPGAIAALANQGQRLLLHVTDFAEDGRPSGYNMLRDADQLKTLYPVGLHIHYAVANRRDFLYLLQLGVSEFQLHYVPNPVSPAAPQTPISDDANFILYGVRGVRRKNLGELLLTAAARKDTHRFGITLPPNRGTEDVWTYDTWHKLSDDLKLPIQFDLGMQPDLYYPELVAESAAMITTSVAEGFGLSFLEPWLSGRPVIGRALPEVITEFGSVGIELEHLYERLLVPIEWIGADRLRRHTINQWRRTLEAYGRSPSPDDYARIAAHWQIQDQIDFGFLDEQLQIPIIKRVNDDPIAAKIIRDQLPSPTVDHDTIIANAEQIRQMFSAAAYGQRVQGIYKRIARCAPGTATFLDPDAVLSTFLQPERFMLLRALR